MGRTIVGIDVLQGREEMFGMSYSRRQMVEAWCLSGKGRDCWGGLFQGSDGGGG